MLLTRHVFSRCFSGRSTMSRDQALALMQEGLIFMRLEAGRVPIPVWLSLEDNNSVLSWRSCGTPTPPPPHSLSVALFNGARALESSDAQALGPSVAADAALVLEFASFTIVLEAPTNDAAVEWLRALDVLLEEVVPAARASAPAAAGQDAAA